jgi:hypothetical protein
LNNSGLVKAAGVVVFLLLVLSLIIASASNGNHKTTYGCRSCGSHANNGQQTSSSTPEIKGLEGKEKEEAVSKAVNSEDFKLVSLILAKAGYRPVFSNSSALRIIRAVGNASITYLVVEIDFEGDRESRPVLALVFLEPYQEAYGFRLDYKRNLLELLVKASNGKTSGLLINDYATGMINGIPPILTQSCNPCEVLIYHCYSYDLWCILDHCSSVCGWCGLNPGCLIPCALIWCVGMTPATCCTHTPIPECVPCQGGNCYMVECYGCPGC